MTVPVELPAIAVALMTATAADLEAGTTARQLVRGVSALLGAESSVVVAAGPAGRGWPPRAPPGWARSSWHS